MNIVLIGYRGCGKTTVGRLLAEQLWKTFVDIDDEICRRFEADSIKQIWDKHGEAAFRQRECEVTDEVLAKDDQVIALGGGTVMFHAGRRAVESADDVVRIYLKCDPNELHRRIHADPTRIHTRPSSVGAGLSINDIETALGDREPVYTAVADHVLDVTPMTPEDVARYIVRLHL